MAILKVKASELGDRWDVRFHASPPISIPEPSVALQEIVTIRRGYSARTIEYVVQGRRGNVVPYLRITDLRNRTVSGTLVRYILNKSDIPRTARVNANEVLFSVAGTIGKVALVPAQFIGAVASGQLVILSPRDGRVHPEYLVRVLEAGYFREQLARVQTGSVIRHLSITELKRRRLTLPNKSTQIEIVEKLRNLEAEYEASIRTQNEIRNQIDSVLGDA